MMKQYCRNAATSILIGLAPGVGLFVALLQVSSPRVTQAAAAIPSPQADGWGDVKGSIVWGGDKIPERLPLNLKDNADKNACLKKGAILDETWIVNPKNKGLRHTFVWLAPKDKEAQIPIHPSLTDIKEKKISIDQPICMFIPHAIALREGQSLVAKNNSGLSHNYKWGGGEVNPGGNVLLPPGGEKEIADLKADRIPVSVECNIHPWMRGWVRVFNHPYYAVTDENGAFEFKNAPAGDWQLMVWHGSGGWRNGKEGRNGETITIKGGGKTDLGNLKYPPPPPPN